MVQEEKPYMVSLSPPCIKLLTRQDVNPRHGTPEWEKELTKEIDLFKFALRIAALQHKGGRYFVVEQPPTSQSWDLPQTRNLLQQPCVEYTDIHMCAYGMRAATKCGEDMPVMKPTRLMSNCPAILEGMTRRCRGEHAHTHEEAGTTIQCQRRRVHNKRGNVHGPDIAYPRQFCQQFAKSVSAQWQYDNSSVLNVESDDGHETDELEWRHYVDDRTGKPLRQEDVLRARRKEVKTLEQMGVYVKVPRHEATARGHKVIGTRWLDVDKSDDGVQSDVRSRYVAKEFATKAKDDIFAATPLLEAVKAIISLLCSSLDGRCPTDRVMVMDVKRAFLHAPVGRETYVELPEEAKENPAEDLVGRLVKAIYGTRDAPLRWQLHVGNVLAEMGFKKGTAQPCALTKDRRGLRVLYHVDDFLVTGAPGQLAWFRKEILKRFESTSAILGPDAGQVREIKFLNRVIRWCSTGITYEADPRHVRTLLSDLGLKQCAAVHTPGVKEEKAEQEKGTTDNDLPKERQTLLRRLIALLNYTSQDRPDLGYAVKECARRMSSPCRETERWVRRIAKYVQKYSRCVIHYRWEARPRVLSVYTDSDWAGCRRTRRSTSGGVVMLGSHVIKHWSKTQNCVALSSAEAELYAIIKASTECLGMKHIMQELGADVKLEVLTDSAAAKGAIQRSGTGRMKHRPVPTLGTRKGEEWRNKVPKDQ